MSCTEIRQINRERICISRYGEKPKCIPTNEQHNCSIDEQHTANIFWTRTISGLWFQQLLCHSTTLMIDTRSPISTPNQQLSNLEPTHIRCSFQRERLTVKEMNCASALHSFKETTYRTDEWTEQLLRLKSWVIFGSPELWMGFRSLWWTVNVVKSSFFFSWLISIVCSCNQCCRF